MAVDLGQELTGYLSRSEAARLLACSAELVAQLARSGRLASIQAPGGRIYRRGDVEQLAAERAARRGGAA